MKFIICFWTNSQNTDFIEDVFVIPPLEKYNKGDEYFQGNVLLKRPHSFVSFVINVEQSSSIKFPDLIKGAIISGALKKFQSFKTHDTIDVAFKVIGDAKEKYPAFFEHDLSFIISFSNWMTFEVVSLPTT